LPIAPALASAGLPPNPANASLLLPDALSAPRETLLPAAHAQAASAQSAAVADAPEQEFTRQGQPETALPLIPTQTRPREARPPRTGALQAVSRFLKRLRPGSALEDDLALSAAYDGAMKELDPDAASRCVNDARMQRALSSDVRAVAPVLAKAYALEDLAELIESVKSPGRLREALLLRLRQGRSESLFRRKGQAASLKDLGFDDEQTLLDWVRRYRPGLEMRVRRAALSWETLSPDLREWLRGKHGDDVPESWTKRPLAERDLADAAMEGFSEFQKLPPPRDAVSWRAFLRRGWDIAKIIDPSLRFDLGKQMQKAEAILRARSELERLAATGEVAAREILLGLDKVEESDLAAQLEFLGHALLEWPELALKERVERAIHEQRASREEESLSSVNGLPFGVRLALAGELLRARLSWSVRVLLGELPLERLGSSLAQYSSATGKIAFNRNEIEAWLKVSAKTRRDFLQDASTQRALARDMAAVVVHEFTHLEQNRWRTRRALLDEYVWEDEIEALAEEYFFSLRQRNAAPREGDGSDAGMKLFSGGWDSAFSGSYDRLKKKSRGVYSHVSSLHALLASRLALAAEMDENIGVYFVGRDPWTRIKRMCSDFALRCHAHLANWNLRWTLLSYGDYPPHGSLREFLRDSALGRDYILDWAQRMREWDRNTDARLRRGFNLLRNPPPA
jgi:hypothetical protein